MGKRAAAANAKANASAEPVQQFTPPQTRTTIRKRKHKSTLDSKVTAPERTARLNAAPTAANGNHCSQWYENDDEDSSSNEAQPPVRHQSNKRANNATHLLNSSTFSGDGGDHNTTIESPKPVYTLRPSVVNGTILYDLTQKPWRLGRPIGKGNFGEIFLASDNINSPVTNENAKFVVKIEPHSNGPLFVEIHCLMNTAKKKPDTNRDNRELHRSHQKHRNTEEDDNDDGEEDDTLTPQIPPSGIPDYIASGSHYFADVRYRFLVLPRFDRDLHSLIKNCRVHQKSVLTLAIQIINVLENLHDKGYCHNDVKAQNLMISKCKYYKRKLTTTTTTTTTTTIENTRKRKLSNRTKKTKYDDHYEEKLPTTDSGNSSEQETHDDNACDTDFIIKRQVYRHAGSDDDDWEENDDDDNDDEDFDDGTTSNSNNSNNRYEYKTPVNRNRKGRPRKNIIEFSGSNPVRSCRRQKRNLIYEEMVSSHYLRPAKRVSYSEFFYEDGVSVKDESQDTNFSSGDELDTATIRRSASNTKARKKALSNIASERRGGRLIRRQECLVEKRNEIKATPTTTTTTTVVPELIAMEEERIFLIDFGLASKFRDNDVHRPFVMDQRRAHDGTLEFTSRDAHMGAHSRRSDLECLGYNLLYWSQGYLPWKDAAQQHQQEKVHRAKEYLMTDVRELLKHIYGKQIPKYLGEFLHQVGQLAYHERPDYARFRRIFEREFQQLGYALNELRLESDEIARTAVRVKDEIENKIDVFDMNKSNHNAWSIMGNSNVTTPFQERTLSNRVSPKNLRSKSDKKTLKKTKFSWTEILLQDPDQIARERAEKEFDREEGLSEVQHPRVRRYEGKPTYAILEIQQRLRMSGRLVEEPNHPPPALQPSTSDADDIDDDEQNETEDEDNIQQDESNDGYMEVSEGSNEEADEESDEMDIACFNDEESDMQDNDTDASEASSVEVPLRHCGPGRPRKTARKNHTNQMKRKSSSAKKTSLKSTEKNKARNNKRVAVEFTTKTRSSANTSSLNVKRSKKRIETATNETIQLLRGEANNIGGDKLQHAASAAGEVEQKKHTNYHHVVHNNHREEIKYYENNVSQQQRNKQGRVSKVERRTRRCLIKTDDTEESNSNFSPDVRSLYKVWSKFNQH